MKLIHVVKIDSPIPNEILGGIININSNQFPCREWIFNYEKLLITLQHSQSAVDSFEIESRKKCSSGRAASQSFKTKKLRIY